MKADHVQTNRLTRHKGGKLYRIDRWDWHQPNMDKGDYSVCEDPAHTHVWATQWQVNEKHPHGRRYQSSKRLAIADLTLEFDIDEFRREVKLPEPRACQCDPCRVGDPCDAHEG